MKNNQIDEALSLTNKIINDFIRGRDAAVSEELVLLRDQLENMKEDAHG